MKIVTVSDLHAPYHHPKAFRFLRAIIKQHKPDVIVCMGDEIDAHAWSAWGKGSATRGASDELQAARRAIHKLVDVVGSNIMLCNSNHVARAARAAEAAGIPCDFLRPVGDVLQAPKGWKWADLWQFDGVLFEHGEGYSGQYAAAHIARDNRQSTAIGHIHTLAGVHWQASKTGRVFGLATGCLIDPASPAFQYGKHHKMKPLIGTGIIINGVPQWLPLS